MEALLIFGKKKRRGKSRTKHTKPNKPHHTYEHSTSSVIAATPDAWHSINQRVMGFGAFLFSN